MVVGVTENHLVEVSVLAPISEDVPDAMPEPLEERQRSKVYVHCYLAVAVVIHKLNLMFWTTTLTEESFEVEVIFCLCYHNHCPPFLSCQVPLPQ